jgi:ribosomal protein S18 acetylase RimI-like enzyme
MVTRLSTRLTIRDAREEDAAALVSLINALNLYEGGAASMTEEALHTALFTHSSAVALQCLVAQMEESLCGFVIYYRGYDTASLSEGFHIADIFVIESMRGHSVGRCLIGELAARCLDSGGQWCSLTALRSNVEAYAFYDALGFHAPDVTFRAIGARGLDLLRMRNSYAAQKN